jgi:hypothetical protein
MNKKVRLDLILVRPCMDKKMTFTAVIHLEEDIYVAECPEV